MVYIKDLAYDNFKEYEKDIKDSIKQIIRIEEIGLGELSKHVGISRQSLHKFFVDNRNISFISLNKMNNFLRVYKEKLDSL